MTSQKRVAYLIALATLTVSAATTTQAQQRWNTQTRQTYTPPSYTPPPARPEPQRETPTYQPPVRQESTPRSVPPENHPSTSFQPENHVDSGVQHTSVNVITPQVITPALRHAMTYNTRPDGVHINPAYFASYYGRDHGFHFTTWSPACPTCGFTLFQGEYYFSWNGGNFGVMTPIPNYWALASDYLYIDIGDDGNYYLYDTQYPGVAVQLTFVQNLGDDQAGADQGDGSGQ
jgi:hypothetical protein